MSRLSVLLPSLCKKWPTLPKRDIEDLVAFALGKTRDEMYLSVDREIDVLTLHAVETLVEKRAFHHPFAYLVGHVNFYGCKIEVNSQVLIPRHETELLLERVLERVKHHQVQVVFDLCTGSGCLGIAFKKCYPSAKVYISDISSSALEVAQKNAITNNVEVISILGNLLDPFKNTPKADLVMCNPPYIAESDFEGLEPSVRDFEPKNALVSGPLGLEMFQELAKKLPMYMNSGGLLALEIGSNQCEQVIKIFSDSPWKFVSAERDYAGLDRFIFLEIE